MNHLILILFFLISISLNAQPVFNVQPIPGKINSPNQEFGPTLSKDGKELYFYSKRDGANYTDIYKSELIQDEWSSPVFMEKLNSPYDDQSPFLAEEQKQRTIFFSSNRDGSIEFNLSNGKLGVSRDIYYSDFLEDKWTNPSPLPHPVNTENIEENPHLFGNTLFFTRYPFGEVAKAKIFFSSFDGKKWNEPEPLPYPINDDSSNIAAIVSNNGEDILFSSNRKQGYGGYDIYRAKIKKGKVISIENLGPEINTPGDEAYIIQNQANNNFIFCRRNPGESYDLYEGREVSKTDISSTLKIRKKISLNTIRFERNSSDILPDSKSALDEIARYLSENFQKNIKVTGHTDLTGNLEANLILSKNRAESVKNYLIGKGIKGNRIQTDGKGSSFPVVNSANDEASKLNRRTEFEILN